MSVGAQDWALCCGLTEEVEAHRRGKQGLSPRPSRATPLSLRSCQGALTRDAGARLGKHPREGVNRFWLYDVSAFLPRPSHP